MMDFQHEITVDKSLVKDCAKAILSVILFHRLFGPVSPQFRQVLDISYPSVVSPTLDSLLDEKTNILLARILEHSESSAQIGLQFFENKKKAKQTWFGKTQDEVWERWVIHIGIHNKKPRNEDEKQASKEFTEKQLRQIILNIINQVNTHRNHVPPITTTDSTPFPYEIVVSGEDDNDGWGALFKKILAEQQL